MHFSKSYIPILRNTPHNSSQERYLLFHVCSYKYKNSFKMTEKAHKSIRIHWEWIPKLEENKLYRERHWDSRRMRNIIQVYCLKILKTLSNRKHSNKSSFLVCGWLGKNCDVWDREFDILNLWVCYNIRIFYVIWIKTFVNL